MGGPVPARPATSLAAGNVGRPAEDRGPAHQPRAGASSRGGPFSVEKKCYRTLRRSPRYVVLGMPWVGPSTAHCPQVCGSNLRASIVTNIAAFVRGGGASRFLFARTIRGAGGEHFEPAQGLKIGAEMAFNSDGPNAGAQGERAGRCGFPPSVRPSRPGVGVPWRTANVPAGKPVRAGQPLLLAKETLWHRRITAKMGPERTGLARPVLRGRTDFDMPSLGAGGGRGGRVGLARALPGPCSPLDAEAGGGEESPARLSRRAGEHLPPQGRAGEIGVRFSSGPTAPRPRKGAVGPARIPNRFFLRAGPSSGGDRDRRRPASGPRPPEKIGRFALPSTGRGGPPGFRSTRAPPPPSFSGSFAAPQKAVGTSRAADGRGFC